jgi:broad specificity phosphatase PhoE
MRYLDIFRHTDNDGDALTPEGVAAAEEVGRTLLQPPYAAFVSTGAARATQMAAILRHAAGQDELPISEQHVLQSAVEDRWREASRTAGKGADLDAIRRVDPDLVDKESQLLGAALRRLAHATPEGARTLVVGHSPTNEAAILGLTGVVISPLGKGDGVSVVESEGRYDVEQLR